MYLISPVNRVYAALRESEGLGNCVIIKAFPFTKKPTRLRHTVITVSPSETRLKNTALGEERACGKFGVSIDVFTPQQEGSPAENGVADSIIKALYPLEPTEIEISEYSASDELGAFSVKLKAFFSGEYGSI